jgi:hypothetical protein
MRMSLHLDCPPPPPRWCCAVASDDPVGERVNSTESTLEWSGQARNFFIIVKECQEAIKRNHFSSISPLTSTLAPTCPPFGLGLRQPVTMDAISRRLQVAYCMILDKKLLYHCEGRPGNYQTHNGGVGWGTLCQIINLQFHGLCGRFGLRGGDD